MIKNLFLTLLVISSSTLLAQDLSQFEATIGDMDNSVTFTTIEVLENNDMIAAGRAVIDGNLESVLIKTTENAEIVFAKYLGREGADFTEAVTQLSDGGFALTGWTTINGSDDLFVAKTDEDGEIEWVRIFGDLGIERGRDIMQTTDGSIVAVGHSNSNSLGLNDVYVVKLDNDGTLEWKNKFGGTGNDNGWGVSELENGNYFVGGNSSSFTDFTSVYALEVAQDGSLNWAKTYSIEDGLLAANDCSFSDLAGMVLGGWVQDLGTTNRDALMLSLSPTGEVWSSLRVGGEEFESIEAIDASTTFFFAAGKTLSYGPNSPGNDNSLIITTNADISVLNIGVFDSDGGLEEFFGVTHYPPIEGGFTACGIRDPNKNPQGSMARFAYDSEICMTQIDNWAESNPVFNVIDGGVSLEDINEESEGDWDVFDWDEVFTIICENDLSTSDQISGENWKLIPNPASTYFYIDNVPNGTEYQVTDITGRLVYRSIYNGKNIQTSDWPSGVYLIQIHQIKTLRLVKN